MRFGLGESISSEWRACSMARSRFSMTYVPPDDITSSLGVALGVAIGDAAMDLGNVDSYKRDPEYCFERRAYV
ncbi:MAG TPA: hypothetical protein VGC07_03775 [Granulicella sp.]